MSLEYISSQALACGADNLTQSNTIEADADIRKSELVAIGTNVALGLVFPYAKLLACYLFSDQTMVLKFNSTGSPVPQINLVAGKPLIWDSTGYLANLFTANVTECYATNSVPANIEFRFVLSA